jgi:predicted ATPase
VTRRYILTGTPGSGKTAILRRLEVDGYAVVEEAATDVIALQRALGIDQPWRDPAFIERIAELQIRRRLAAGGAVFDRSPVCTLALSRHLGVPVPDVLRAEIDRMLASRVYQPVVFFVRNQGFVEPTEARRITFEESLAFERLHEVAYRELGFSLVEVPAGPLEDRASVVRGYLRP